MSLLLRLVFAWLALAWSGSAAAPDQEARIERRDDAIARELPGHATGLTVRGDSDDGMPAGRPASAALPDAPGLRRTADAGRYLLLLLMLALPAPARRCWPRRLRRARTDS